MYTWLADQNITASIGIDYAPLLRYLVDNGMLAQDMFMGTLQFGSETYHADGKVRFIVERFDMQVEKSVDGGNRISNEGTKGASVETGNLWTWLKWGWGLVVIGFALQ